MSIDHSLSDDTRDTNLRTDWRTLSWSSIILGVIIALAISILLHVLGIGVSASSIDSTYRPSDMLMILGGVGGVWFLASTAISLFIGGFVASTLAHTFTGKRASTYGLAVWALTTLISMSVIVPALVKSAGTALSTGGTAIERTGNMLVAGSSTAAQNAPNGLAENIQRSLIGTTTNQVDPVAVQQITNLVSQRILQGQWTSQQRDELNNAVAKAANISPDDARRRVDEAQNTINAMLEQAQQRLRQVAEVARQTISVAAYWVFGTMLLGLIAAVFGARYGELDEKELPAFARLRLHSKSY